MNDASLIAFSRCSLLARKRAQPELEKRFKQMKEQLKLFKHILTAAPDEVNEILNANPHLSLLRYEARDKGIRTLTNTAGQHISIQGKTAYQLTLGEDDTEIAAMCRASILNLADRKEMNTQFNEQFQQGWEEEEKERWAPAFDALDTLTQAIRDAKPDDITMHGYYKLTVRKESDVAQALAQFRLSLNTILNNVVTRGRHFNPNLFLRAFQIFDTNYENSFGGSWTDPRALLFWQRVIGYIELIFPANYVHAACDGFSNTRGKLKNGKPQTRSFRFYILDSFGFATYETQGFYPLSHSRLGVDFAIGGGKMMVADFTWTIMRRSATGIDFSELMLIKNSFRENQNYQPDTSKSSCLTM